MSDVAVRAQEYAAIKSGLNRCQGAHVSNHLRYATFYIPVSVWMMYVHHLLDERSSTVSALFPFFERVNKGLSFCSLFCRALFIDALVCLVVSALCGKLRFSV